MIYSDLYRFLIKPFGIGAVVVSIAAGASCGGVALYERSFTVFDKDSLLRAVSYAVPLQLLSGGVAHVQTSVIGADYVVVVDICDR